MTGRRLDDHGRVRRDEPLRFRWRGRTLRGFRGDTLASALLANGVRVAGRSFKYHRPRGLTSAGEDEAGVLVTVGEGPRRTPNLKAPTVELEDGLVAEPQNCWPSPDFDLGEVNDLIAPFLAAGFYYKTFMGPWRSTRAWMAAERLIRRAAGLGRADPRADPDWYEHVHGHCDLLVVGSGPAGLAAAMEAAEAGLDVVVAERDFELGGDLLTGGKVGAHSAEYWRVEALAALRKSGCARLMPRTSAFGLYDHGLAGMVERVVCGGPEAPRERLHLIRARRIVVATGAHERLLAFGDNDRPGVMSADAARTYVDRFGVAPGRRAVVAAVNDSGYRVATALADAGLTVTLLDSREAPPENRVAGVRELGVEVIPRAVPVRALGRLGVRRLIVGRHRGDGEAALYGTLPCDLVAVAGGWNPALQLTSHAGLRPVWSDRLACFLPGEGDGTVRACGAAAGVWLRPDVIDSGRAAGRAVALDLGATRRRRLKAPAPGGWDAPLDPVWEVRARRRKLKSFVDLANDVTADDLRLAHREGFDSAEHMKRYTTHAMGPDQGRAGGLVGQAIMAAARGLAVPEQGVTTFRPPVAPVSLGAFAGIEGGRHWLPVRRTPFHARAEAAGAKFVDAGLWKRPWYFPRPGETLTAASMREAAMVRGSVGVCDVSTLGKILVQGPDAAAFLDRVYSNLMSTLPVGRARYGFMLREDGIVLDDGTLWRLAETEFLVTASTGHAEEVEEHLCRWAEARWPELRVAITAVTEAWAGLALAGPRARAALERVAAADAVSDATLPFMGVRELTVAGLRARVARISFSGELAYEVYVRAPDAPALWDALRAAAEAEGGGLYGLEALDILRVEKGHVTGREADGRVTLADLGLAGMASRKKPYLGRALMGRPGLTDPRRPRLVGLTPVDPRARLQPGAILTAPETESGFGLGHVSSIADSPALGMRIALGFVSGGTEALEGQVLVARDPTGRRETRVRVVPPRFVDPEGERMRG